MNSWTVWFLICAFLYLGVGIFGLVSSDMYKIVVGWVCFFADFPMAMLARYDDNITKLRVRQKLKVSRVWDEGKPAVQEDSE
jgi:hypothetical protein